MADIEHPKKIAVASTNELPDPLEDYIEDFLKFRATNSKEYKCACNITRDVIILAKIYNNVALFRLATNGRLFAELSVALFELESSKNNILLGFPELDIFGLFTETQYTSFVSGLISALDFGNISFDITQVVLTDIDQKFVFAFSGNHMEKLQEHACKCFKTTARVSKTHITVNIICKNEAEITENYNKLYNFMNDHKDEICCEAIKPIPVTSRYGYNFRKYSCNDAIVEGGHDISKTFMKTPPAASIVNNYNITINGPMNGNIAYKNGSSNVTMAKEYVDKKQNTINWIKKNPPELNELVSDYYVRYSAENQNALAVNIFGKMVKAEGHKTVKGTNSVRRYIK